MAQAASLLDQRENRYYWLRLKEDFFEDDRVRIIESSPDGEKILLFYLKLMLKSIKGEGEVLKGTGIACTPQTLGAITGTAPEVVQQALELLQSLGMIELQGEKLFIPQTMQLLGSEGKSTERVRRSRSRSKKNSSSEQGVTSALQCNTDVTHDLLQCNTDVTRGLLQCNIEYRDKSIEIRDKSINNNISCSNAQQTDSHLSGKTEQDESLVVQKADDRKAKSPCPSMTPEEKDTLFNRFWQAYPRKVGKGSAQKVFDRLQVDRPLLEEMLCKIDQAKRSRQWQDMQYIPSPATWLNGRRWEDELPAENRQSAKEVNFDANTGTADSAADASPWRRGLIG